MPRTLTFLSFLVLVWTSVAAVAQTPGLPGGGGAATADQSATDQSGTDQSATAPAPSTQTLIDLLKDDKARAELIRQLEAGMQETAPAEGGDTGAAAPASESGAAPQDEEPVVKEAAASIGRRIAELTADTSQTIARTFGDLVSQLRVLPSTLAGLKNATDPQVLWDALSDLAFVIAATYLSFVVLRLLSRRISNRLAQRAKEHGWFGTAMLSLLSSAIDLAVVALAWAAGYALTLAFYKGFGVIQIRQSLYLNAFLSVEMAKVAGRAILAPRFRALRLITLSDEGARSLWRWLNWTISILGYGLLLAVPVVNFAAGYYSGQALSMTLSAGVVVYTMIRVMRARQPVADWLVPGAAEPPEGDETAADTPRRSSFLHTLAGLWHLPVLFYLLVLLVLVIARPGNILLPLLKASGLVLATVVGGLMLTNLMARSARHGVRLPEGLKSRLPLLERRLNSMLPRFLLVMRLLVVALVVAVSLNIAGVWDIGAWFGTAAGAGFVSNALMAFVIIAVAFLIWLAMASWVEFRLNPLFGSVPTPRETTLLTLLRNAATIAILILTLMFVLSQIGLDIAPLLASAGVLGLAIGFGAQKMVQDIITGIFIQFENAINVGDVVTAGGTTGVVEKLTVRSVSLRDLQGVYHIIPFSSVDMVSNYMRDFSFHVADIGVAYREDMEFAKQAMHDAFDELREDPDYAPDIIGDLEWFGLNSFDDSSITLRARIKTVPGKQWGIGRAYNLIIKRIFDERNIEIPFPHQTIYFGEDREGKAPPLHVVKEAPKPAARDEAQQADTDDSGLKEPTQDAPPDED